MPFRLLKMEMAIALNFSWEGSWGRAERSHIPESCNEAPAPSVTVCVTCLHYTISLTSHQITGNGVGVVVQWVMSPFGKPLSYIKSKVEFQFLHFGCNCLLTHQGNNRW